MTRSLPQTRRAIGLRLLASTALWLLPLLAAVIAWGIRLQAPLGAGLAAAALSLLAFAAWHRQRVRHDDRWLARRLNTDPALQDSADLAGVAVFKRRLKDAQHTLNESFAACWNDAAQREQAERLMRRMQFLDKLTYEVRQLEERLDD